MRRRGGEILRLIVFLREKRRVDFFSAAKLILLVDVRGEVFSPLDDVSHGLLLGCGADRLQQEVGELGEGGGFLARDTALRQQAKNLGESAVHAGSGGKVAGSGIEFGEIELPGLTAT